MTKNIASQNNLALAQSLKSYLFALCCSSVVCNLKNLYREKFLLQIYAFIESSKFSLGLSLCPIVNKVVNNECSLDSFHTFSAKLLTKSGSHGMLQNLKKVYKAKAIEKLGGRLELYFINSRGLIQRVPQHSAVQAIRKENSVWAQSAIR